MRAPDTTRGPNDRACTHSRQRATEECGDPDAARTTSGDAAKRVPAPSTRPESSHRALACDEPRAIEAILARTLRPHDACVDVGAHLGSFLSLLVRLAPNGRHMAFEPVPIKAELLSRRFPEVEVHALVLGEVNTTKTFYLARATTAASGLTRTDWHGSAYTELQVTQSRLDDVIPDDRPVDFLKLDVEGNELNVLDGATRILEHQKPLILFESTFKALARPVFECLTRRGYVVFTPQDLLSSGRPLEIAAFEKGHEWPFRAFNYFAIPRAGGPERRDEPA